MEVDGNDGKFHSVKQQTKSRDLVVRAHTDRGAQWRERCSLNLTNNIKFMVTIFSTKERFSGLHNETELQVLRLIFQLQSYFIARCTFAHIKICFCATFMYDVEFPAVDGTRDIMQRACTQNQTQRTPISCLFTYFI